MKIHLKKKTVIPVEINNRECILTIDAETIDHFQRTNNVGMLKFYERMANQQKNGKIEVKPIIKLLGSIIRDANTNKILGTQFLSQFDDFSILQHLSPLLSEVFSDNMPMAKDESEKK